MVRCLLAAVAAAVLSPCVLAGPVPARPVIMVTGYWPPTNNIVRRFSPSAAQNPAGWVGADWEGRGYDVRAYFPEFPGQTGPSWGRGSGDFEVDYQDTLADFDRIVGQIRPVAILSFSRANTSVGWELEPAYQRWRLPGETVAPGSRAVPQYASDGYQTLYPSDAAPILADPIGTIRRSTLPMQAIVDAVGAALPNSAQISPFIDAFDPASTSASAFSGNFLSGYLPYLAARHRELNAPGASPFPVYATGHVHVGTNLDEAVGTAAAEVTLRTLAAYLDSVIPTPGTGAGAVCGVALAARRRRR